MGQCSSCGTEVPEYEINYANGMPVCISCMSSAATTNDKPCSRCGVYIPAYELKMFKSRLYCNYCIMDMMDEDDRQAKAASERISASQAQDDAAEKRMKESLEQQQKKPDSPDLPGTPGANPSKPFAQAIRTTKKQEEKPGLLFLALQKIAGIVSGALIEKHIEKPQASGVEPVKAKKTPSKSQKYMDAYPLSEKSGELGDACRMMDERRIGHIIGGLAGLIDADDEDCTLGKAACALALEKQLRILRAVYFAQDQKGNGLAFDSVKAIVDSVKERG